MAPQDSASKFCTQCGSTIIAGNRFCTQCGNPVATKTVPPPEPVRVVEATTPPRQAVIAGTPTTVPVEESAARPQSPPIFVEIPAPPQEPTPAETAGHASVPEPVPNTFPILTSTPEVNDSGPSEPERAKSREQKRSRRLPALVALAALCVLGAGGFWWHTSHSKATLPSDAAVPAPTTTAATPIPTLTPAPDSISATNNTVVTDKPSAANPGGAVAETEPQPRPIPSKIAIAKPRVDAGDRSSADVPVASNKRDSTARQPQPPPHEPVPATPTSGTLHYTGPPVRYGESVTFANLPPDRLKFTFDHQSWQPLISRQANGTKTLSLRSLSQVEQPHCDVGWEILK